MKEKTKLKKIEAKRPRVVVYRSNKYIYAQVLDGGRVIASVSEKSIKSTKSDKGTKSNKAEMVGIELAKLAIEKKVKDVVFDKGKYRYHGRVKVLADALRKGGLNF